MHDETSGSSETAAKRKRILADPSKRQTLCAMIAVGSGLDAAARHVGCSVWTVRREAERDEQFAQQLREAHTAAELHPLRALRKAAATNWRAAAWLLERTRPEQFSKRRRNSYDQGDVLNLLDEVVSIVLEECPARERESIRLRLLALIPPEMPEVT